MSNRFNSLDQQTQNILFAILQFQRDIPGQISLQIREEMMGITVTVSQILSRLEDERQATHDLHLQTRSALLEEICKRNKTRYKISDEIVSGIEMLSVSRCAEDRLRDEVGMAILKCLTYDEMTNRFEDVDEAHPETFEWAFSAPAEDQSWSDLSYWLRGGDGVYWVNGKAGSGKSTFMKHLLDDRFSRLHHFLSDWANGSPFLIATFFFWCNGTKLQKSQLGFLRALLYQVLHNYPRLIPIVLLQHWSQFYSMRLQGTTLPSRLRWKLADFKQAFGVLSTQSTMALKICLVVDGLDEFEGDDDDYEGIGAFFRDITDSKQIKVLLSSRPLVVFEDLFGKGPNLKLQNLTYRDIEKYVHDKFSVNTAFSSLARREPEAAPALLREIVEKADGVFVWVKLVVRNLLSGLRNRDDLVELSEKLQRLPREIKPLYKRLFELIEPYERWASRAIQVLRCNRKICNISSDDVYGVDTHVKPITISEFLLAMSEDAHNSLVESMTRERFQLKCEETRLRLTARCAGFLEVTNIPGTFLMGPNSLIDYFHRTAKDFLESEDVWATILSETENTDFNPCVTLMGSSLWYIRVQVAFSEQSASYFIYDNVEASQQVRSFMAYAIHADPHIPSRRTQTSLIDQLDDLVSKYDKGGQWLYDLIPCLKGRYKLLEVSTLLGLKGYVRDKLNMSTRAQLENTTNSLLYFVLSDACVVGGLMFRDFQMLSLLLEFVADQKSTSPALVDTLKGAQHRFAQLRKRAEDCPEIDSKHVHELHVRIGKFLSAEQPPLIGQRSNTKRLAGAIEDTAETSTKSAKLRKKDKW